MKTTHRPGTFRPASDPLAGVSPADTAELAAAAADSQRLVVSRVRRLLQNDGLCQQVGGDFWFPSGKAYLKGVRVGAAVEVCRRCPVRRPCLLLALRTKERHGVWGGYTAEERSRLLTQMRAAVARRSSKGETK